MAWLEMRRLSFTDDTFVPTNQARLATPESALDSECSCCEEEAPRGRKRRRSFEADTRDNMADGGPSKRQTQMPYTQGAITSVGWKRPYEDVPPLSPTTGLKSPRSRSTSPSRLLLERLERATPPIVCREVVAPQDRPKAVQALYDTLQVAYTKASYQVIPLSLESFMEDTEEDGILELAYDPLENPPIDLYPRNLTTKVENIHDKARICHDKHKDESAWVDVVRKVFRAAGFHTKGFDRILEINSVQTQRLHPSYLPIMPFDNTRIERKVDLAIAIAVHESPTHSLLYQERLRTYGNLSHMTDAYTGTVPLICGIEVKGTNGDLDEAVAQLAVWSTAGLQKLHSMTSLPPQDIAPFVGFVVAGHQWHFYIIWLNHEKKVSVWGPLVSPRTSTYLGIFTLLKFLRKLHGWIMEAYWPWFLKFVLKD